MECDCHNKMYSFEISYRGSKSNQFSKCSHFFVKGFTNVFNGWWVWNKLLVLVNHAIDLSFFFDTKTNKQERMDGWSTKLETFNVIFFSLMIMVI